MRQLAVQGESNGGLLTAAALVQRPDLWAAVVSRVPIIDLLHLDQDPLTYAIGRAEYGDPAVPEEREWLAAISPQEAVRSGVAYPPALVVAGVNDPRRPSWHAANFVKAVREAHGADNPILLRVLGGQGHGAAQRSATLDDAAEGLAFIAHHTGLEI